MARIFENAEYKSQLNYYRRMLFNSKNCIMYLVIFSSKSLKDSI
jgi:hypothetical protein